MTSPATPGRRRMPYHPPLVHVPIGASITAAVLDAISAATGSGHGSARNLYEAATWVLMVGMGVMFVAALAGLADRSRVLERGPAARRGVNRHAAIMGTVMVLTIAELTLRRQRYPDAGAPPAAVLVVEAIAVALTIFGLHVGGKLVHGRGQGLAAGVAPAPAPAGGIEEPAER
ncbi:DUF2231 domain-containing protein [Actinomadura nitritigenes]|uniref:DUF2231 domain-containing protein n=1 Tax=Actinomadura nitritigenes TaxID=134602 RepID=UPI0036763F3E